MSGSKRRLSERAGLALVTTLLVLSLIGIVTAVFLSGAVSNLRATLSDYQTARTFYAAEASAEAALAQLEDLLKDGSLTAGDLATIETPTLDGFSFEGFTVELVDTARVETVTDGPFAGLYGLTQDVRIYSPAADATEAMSAIILNAKTQAIPLFQFGVFFDGDLEATNGPPMEFEGRVHSNGNIYLSSDNAWYREPITTPQRVFHRRKDQDDVKDGVFINNASGDEVPLDFDSESIVDFDAFKTRSCDQFDCRLKTDAFGVEPLNLPLPEGVPPYELLRPRDGDDTDGEKEVKYSWSADTWVLVDLADLRPKPSVCDGGGGGGKRVPNVTILRDGLPIPDDNTKCDIFDWKWAAFYDAREEELKDVLNIDIDELITWIGADVDREMRNIYVEFTLPGDINSYSGRALRQVRDASIDPAVRVINSQTLPSPLTVATAWPLYTLGDHNSFDKKPAALVGDGITILSNDWADGDNRPADPDFDDDDDDDDDDDEPVYDPDDDLGCEDTDGNALDDDDCAGLIVWADANWSMKRAEETKVYAAILAGHWATPCDWAETGCPGGYSDWYGGGIENFPRFLERWRDVSDNKVVFEYKGALISPFTSQKTTGTWNGTYYEPPQREWSFDTDFRNPNLLPPGTPNVGVILRSAFREAF